MGLVPMVIAKEGNSERVMDIFSVMLKERVIFLNSQVEDHMASLICAQLLFLESQSPEKEINLYINSPGGVVTAGMAIYDTMQYISPPVTTICMGQACSMGSLLLTAGAPGKRFALPNARIMLHQPSGGASGQATDILIHAQEILNMKKNLNNIYVKHTGKKLKEIEEGLERDNFMNAEQALEFGVIDEIVSNRT